MAISTETLHGQPLTQNVPAENLIDAFKKANGPGNRVWTALKVTGGFSLAIGVAAAVGIALLGFGHIGTVLIVCAVVIALIIIINAHGQHKDHSLDLKLSDEFIKFANQDKYNTFQATADCIYVSPGAISEFEKDQLNKITASGSDFNAFLASQESARQVKEFVQKLIRINEPRFIPKEDGCLSVRQIKNAIANSPLNDAAARTGVDLYNESRGFGFFSKVPF